MLTLMVGLGMLEQGHFVIALVVGHLGLGAAHEVLARLDLVTSSSGIVLAGEALLVSTWSSVLFGNCDLLLVGRLQHLWLSISLL